jgi:hypothetical protein
VDYTNGLCVHTRAGSLKQFGFITQGEAQKDLAAVDVELAADVCAVIFDRAGMAAKLVGKLPAGLVLSNQLQDAALGRSQVGKPSALTGKLRNPAAVKKIGCDCRARGGPTGHALCRCSVIRVKSDKRSIRPTRSSH